MTTNWKSTINHAYTTPDLLHPTLQKSIPSLIRDEISKLANLKLFQTNIQASSSHSQVPVDMKFTDDSLHIRISKKAPWISLLPSTEPMSPEERAVDAVRRDVMEKIVLLWGGVSDSSSDESDSGNRSSSSSSTEGNTSRSRRTRSRRSRRDEHNRQSNHNRRDSITISGNTIDSSTHTTTNNYYGCTGSHSHPPHINAEEEVFSKRNTHTKTDPIMNPSHPSRDSHNESKKVIPDEKKPIKRSRKNPRIEEQSSTKKFEHDIDDLTEQFSKLHIKDSKRSGEDSRIEGQPSTKKFKHDIDDLIERFSKLHIKDSAEEVSSLEDQDLMTFPSEEVEQAAASTIHDLENIASDLERIISKEETPTSLDDLDISDSEDETSSTSSSTREMPDLMTFPSEEEPVVHSTINDLENIASDDSSKQRSPKRSMENATIEQQPTSKKLRRDSFEAHLKKTKKNLRKNHHTISKKPRTEPKWIELANRRTKNFKDPLDRTQDLHLDSETTAYSIPILRPTSYNTEDPFAEIRKFVDEYDRESKPVSHLIKLIELQVELAQEQPDVTNMNNLISFLQADSTHNSNEDYSDGESTLVASEETAFEQEPPESADFFIDDEIKDQPTLSYRRADNFAHQDDVLDSVLDSGDIFREIERNETQDVSTQTDIHPRDKETLLEEKLQRLQSTLERTKSVHKDELASLLRAQDRLATEANTKIKKVLEDSIKNERESFPRLEHVHKKSNKLLEDSTVEIEDLKKALAELNVIDLAKKAESDRLRTQFYAPAPIIISAREKIETKTQSTQVEDTAKPTTSIPVESKSVTVKTNPPVVSKQKRRLQDRNLEAASLMMLRKEKAALELAIQKNQFPKSDLATKRELLRRIDEELVRRNQRPQKSSASTMTKESKIKTPLTHDERALKDLGKEPFNTLKTKLNDKRTNNK